MNEQDTKDRLRGSERVRAGGASSSLTKKTLIKIPQSTKWRRPSKKLLRWEF